MSPSLAEKKAAAFAALAAMKAGTICHDPAVDLSNTPHAPFDLNLEGEPHRVTTSGKKLALFYLGGGEPVMCRYLVEGELEVFWEKRIVK